MMRKSTLNTRGDTMEMNLNKYDRWLSAPYVETEETEEEYVGSDDWKYDQYIDDEVCEV